MATDADKLKSEVLAWIRAIRFGGVTLPDLVTELRLCRGVNATVETAFACLEALRDEGLVECMSDGEWIAVTQPEPMVAKQGNLF